MRDDVITVHQKLSTTLRFLATGQSYEDLKFLTRIAPQTIGQFILPTCNAIISVLNKKKIIKTPTTKDEWKELSTSFERKWNFPHCIGAVDGKHVNIKKPANSGSYYYNHKKTFSIVLLGIANANYEFIYAEAGANGRASDGRVQSNSKFFEQLENDDITFPDPEDLPVGNYGKMPYVMVGDDAFALSENLMKPFTGQLTDEQRIYCYRLSRARRIIENCFGILASRFRILFTTINLVPEKAARITLACCYLHNYILKKNRQLYFQGTDIENIDTATVQEDSWRSDPQQLVPLQPTQKINSITCAKQVRNKFCQYFYTDGAVSWQWKMLGLQQPSARVELQ
ncbi:uncharacterized protein [Palaemon carinicauda]|uniref:uncharacterized protein n=1 Tax=Palaemon carinicauda TaxID=392227 RepID=UPI0035B58DEF